MSNLPLDKVFNVLDTQPRPRDSETSSETTDESDTETTEENDQG